MPKKINVKKWLTDRQLRLYDYNTRQGDHYKDIDIVQAIESLAAFRATAERRLALLSLVASYKPHPGTDYIIPNDLGERIAAELRGGG